MAIPTDRGYAVIIPNQDATTTVMVCTGIQDQQPAGVFAEHVRAHQVRIDPALHLEKAGSYALTTQIVEVFTASGALHIRAPRHALN